MPKEYSSHQLWSEKLLSATSGSYFQDSYVVKVLRINKSSGLTETQTFLTL